MGFFLWLSDVHLDPFYGNKLAVTYHNGNNCSLPENATLYQYPYGRAGCDAPFSLVKSALHSVSAQNKTIQFVLVTGDFSRHSVDKLGDNGIDMIDFAGSVVSTSISAIRTILPGVPIIPVLGNNDVVPDYYLEVNNEHDFEDSENSSENVTASSIPGTNKVLSMATDALREAFLSEEEAQSYAHGGYFSRIIKTSSSSSILVLSLNTVLYSPNHKPNFVPDGPDSDDDPLGQFAWMQSQLKRAARATNDDANHTTAETNITGIYLTGHIPPTIGSFRHSQMWHERYVDRYVAILNDYHKGKYSDVNDKNSFSPPPPIQGHMFGHFHTEEFRLLTYHFETDVDETKGTDPDSSSAVDTADEKSNALVLPLLVTSSITPIYGSNPSWRMVEYDDDSGLLIDYTTHYLDLGRNFSRSEDEKVPSKVDWTELPSFTKEYDVPDLSDTSFETILSNFEAAMEAIVCQGATLDGNSLWKTFLSRQNLYSSAPDDTSSTQVMVDWLCTMRATSKDSYSECLSTRMSRPCGGPGKGTILILIAANVLAIFGVLAIFWIATKKRGAKRRMYHRPNESPTDGIMISIPPEAEENNAVAVNRANSSSLRGIELSVRSSNGGLT